MRSDPDLFHEPRVGLSLRKPASWNFLPPAWSPTAVMKRAPAEGAQAEWAKHAKLPICCAQGVHGSARHPKPTLQVAVRPHSRPDHAGRLELLHAMESSLAAAHGARVETSSPDAYLDGQCGISLHCRFVLISQVEGEPVRMACLSRVHVVFHQGFALTIGLSSAQNRRYFREADFDAILASIHLD